MGQVPVDWHRVGPFLHSLPVRFLTVCKGKGFGSLPMRLSEGAEVGAEILAVIHPAPLVLTPDHALGALLADLHRSVMVRLAIGPFVQTSLWTHGLARNPHVFLGH